MRYWLMKSEPDEVSFDDVLAAPGATVAWFGVRNYQARNFMRDAMAVGDGVLFYHSGCASCRAWPASPKSSAAHTRTHRSSTPPAITTIPKATPETPRWISVDVKAVEAGRFVPLAELRTVAALEDMVLLQKGSRLSISPVTKAQYTAIVALVRGKGAP